MKTEMKRGCVWLILQILIVFTMIASCLLLNGVGLSRLGGLKLLVLGLAR